MNANTNPDTRASLIARVRDLGNGDAWKEFASIYEPVILRFIQGHGLQSADAEEISQEVLSRVVNSISSWNGGGQQSTFRGWLYRITRNLTIDFLRKRKSELAKAVGHDGGMNQIPDSESSASCEFQAEYEKQIFHWAAEKLKPTFKAANWQAFWLSTVEGLPIEEVAQRLSMECSAIYVARSRIMSRLAKLIQEHLKDTSGGFA